MKYLTLSIGLALSTAFFACGGAHSDHSASTSNAIGTAQEGERCGGFVANPKQCDETQNLYCKYSHVPDLPGTCTSCDNFGVLPHIMEVCADGSTQGAHWVPNGGTCKIEVCPASSGGAASGQAGDTCTSSSSDLTSGCSAGLYCDCGTSTCTSQGNPGDFCDLSVGSPLADGACQAGLSCVVADPNGDPNSGICQ
jgi:hypothetical protein